MLDPHGALICTMVIVSAADSDMTDAELAIIGDIVGHLPVFRDFDRDTLAERARILLAIAEPRGRAGRSLRRDQARSCPPICARPPMRWPAMSPPPTARRSRRNCGCSN